jgi:hypothetical protein
VTNTFTRGVPIITPMLSEKRCETEFQNAGERLALARAGTVLSCPCGHAQTVGETELDVVEFYVPPRGCSGGDYMTEGDDPEFQFSCGGCGIRHRIYKSRVGAEQYTIFRRLRRYFKKGRRVRD